MPRSVLPEHASSPRAIAPAPAHVARDFMLPLTKRDAGDQINGSPAQFQLTTR
jgi:hypothetical protein